MIAMPTKESTKLLKNFIKGKVLSIDTAKSE